MNGEEERREPALALICVSAKQDPPEQSRSLPPVSQTPAESPVYSAPAAIEARPLQSVAPEADENGIEEKRREKEHRKRSKNWTRIETARLIRIRSDMDPRFCRSGKKSDLWNEISDLLRNSGVCRDPQQCRDKWEKLTAAYKEVREGIRDREDFPFFSELDPVLSGKPPRRESLPPPPVPAEISSDGEETEDASEPRKRSSRRRSQPEIDAVKEVIESVMAEQRRFLADLVEAMERRERFREKIRQEREERWREEDRERRAAFENAILLLAKKKKKKRKKKKIESEEEVEEMEEK